MTLSGRHISLTGCAALVASLLVLAIIVIGSGWDVLGFPREPNVRKVDPLALSEIRKVGQLIGEDTDIAHEWENDYVEAKHLAVYLKPGTGNDIITEAEKRLHQAGWHVWNREPPEIFLESAKWPATYMVVEGLGGADILSEKLQKAVNASSLAVSRMVYIVIHR
ncbi:hypothetical protein ACQEUU_34090 [Nonomuraea sp. CA-218870]|uniref:LytR family transcriptional regulator n=1 Tax=Nonomuraea corallina TaxID=2989783 RepID=A0ABT4SD64_9ACTN|nr:hypothetical protein [Nonomuraea corallina]MDA0635117.1 hypothetical protein [Nonomuraea corallina]